MVDVPDEVAVSIIEILNDVAPTAPEWTVVQEYIAALTPEPPVVVPTVLEQIATFIRDGVTNSTDVYFVGNQIIEYVIERLDVKLDSKISSDFIEIIKNNLRYE